MNARKTLSRFMEYTDTYKTILAPNEGLIKEKGSRFIAFAFPVSDEQQIKEIIASLMKEHHSARHHCFAWRLGADHRSFRVNDDGEPSGTAGRPIFSQIQQHGLTDILVIVVRYFGGILLGTSGLTNAYKQAAAEVLNNATVVEKVIEITIEANFDYLAMNDFMTVLKEYQLELKESHFDNSCKVNFCVRKQLKDRVMEKLGKIDHLKAHLIVGNP
ncbi:MAG: YigZ family protein [Mariniphaga sp.]